MPSDTASRILSMMLDCQRWPLQFNHGDLLPTNWLASAGAPTFIAREFAGCSLPGYDLALRWTILACDHDARRRIVQTVAGDETAAPPTFITQAILLARELRMQR